MMMEMDEWTMENGKMKMEMEDEDVDCRLAARDSRSEIEIGDGGPRATGPNKLLPLPCPRRTTIFMCVTGSHIPHRSMYYRVAVARE